MQEVAIAKSCLIFRDNIITSAKGLCRAEQMMKALIKHKPTLRLTWNLLQDYVRNFHVMEAIKSNHEDSVSIMWWARYHKSSDPRDKIIAIRSLLKEAGVSLPPPDYSQFAAQIYREAMIAILPGKPKSSRSRIKFSNRKFSSPRSKKPYYILPNQNADVLNVVHGLGNTSGLCSWVPDWSLSIYPLYLCPNADSDYAATGQSMPVMSLLNNETKLSVKGIMFESIASRANVAFSLNTLDRQKIILLSLKTNN